MLPYLTYFAKFSYNVDQLLPIAFISNKLYSQLHFLPFFKKLFWLSHHQVVRILTEGLAEINNHQKQDFRPFFGVEAGHSFGLHLQEVI